MIPLLMVFYYGLTDRSGAFTLANILAIGSSEHLKALWLSLALAGVSTVICLLLAYPLALILRKRHIGKGSFVVFIFILPMWMNFLLRTMAWQTLLEKNGVINAFLTILHLPNIAIINTPAAIILGMVYNFLPFMVLPIYTALIRIDYSLVEAALDLGARPLKTFFNVIVPLTKGGIIAGSMLVFIPAVGEFVIPELLGGPDSIMIGRVLWQEFFNNRDWPVASAVAIIMLLLLIVPIMWFHKHQQKSVGEHG